MYSFFSNQKADVRKWQARADALQNLLVRNNIEFSEVEVDDYIKKSHPDVWNQQYPSKDDTSKSGQDIDMSNTKTGESSTDA